MVGRGVEGCTEVASYNLNSWRQLVPADLFQSSWLHQKSYQGAGL